MLIILPTLIHEEPNFVAYLHLREHYNINSIAHSSTPHFLECSFFVWGDTKKWQILIRHFIFDLSLL